MLRVASDFTQLALHALAHLPLTAPAAPLDPAYLDWSAANLPDGARGPIERDAEGLASLCERTPAAGLLQSTPELFEDIAQLRASATRDLEQLTEDDVAAPTLLATYQRTALSVAERWRRAVALAAPAFATVWHEELLPRCVEALEAVREPLAEARRLHPALSEVPVELAWPLGRHGRAFERRIVVGIPQGWGAVGPWDPALTALHEAAAWARAPSGEAHDVGEARDVRAAWSALVDVCERMGRASGQLREAHARWLATQQMESLCRDAAAHGLVTNETAARIAERPDERAELLRA